MKLSGQKIKSYVQLKDCLKIIYGTIFGIFSRPWTFSLYVEKGERLYGNSLNSETAKYVKDVHLWYTTIVYAAEMPHSENIAKLAMSS